MSATLRVGTVEAKRGERAHGYLVVGELDQLSFARGQIRLPLIVARGKTDGPTLVLIAGQHPGEFVGMNAAIALATETDLEALSGTVVALPMLNPYGVRRKVPYICPFDGLNMNRQWPGTHGGSVSSRTAYTVWREAISQADFLVDLHGGDYPEYQADYAICFETGDSHIDGRSRLMAQHFGAPYIRVSPTAEGGHETGPAARMAMQALRIPAIVTEVGDAGVMDTTRLGTNVRGLRNVLKVLGMLPGQADPPPAGQRQMISRTAVLARSNGLSRLAVEIGQSVAQGDLLATIRDVTGAIAEEVVAPIAGDVVQLFYQGWMNEGEIVAKIASIASPTQGGSE